MTIEEKHEFCTQAREVLQGLLKVHDVASDAKFKECEAARWAWSAAILTGRDGISEFKAYLVAKLEYYEITQQISSSCAIACTSLLIAVDAMARKKDAPKGKEVAT